jgi:ATP-dependent DNA helicase RecG
MTERGETSATAVHHPLGEPLQRVLGAPAAKKLAKAFEMDTVGDLMRHYPRRYQERGALTPLAELELGAEVTVLAEVRSINSKTLSRPPHRVQQIVVTDGSTSLTLVFFGRHTSGDRLRAGVRGLFAGTVGVFKGERQLAHPAFELLSDEVDADAAAGWAESLIPIYPSSGTLKSWDLPKYTREALAWLAAREAELPDPLPARLRAQQGLIGLGQALREIHRPSGWDEVHRAQRRLRWEEAFVLQTALVRRRLDVRRLPATPREARPDGLLVAFDERLPFELTEGQRAVGAQIAADLASSHPMHRLLQGDVGSGKTVVALRAMLAVVDAGGQAALLAPTEVLAQQHHRSLCALLGPLAEAGRLGGDQRGPRVVLLTGSSSQPARRAALLDAASGAAGIVVGTHALLEDRVDFADLGLVVVDEQHRFGVEQRDALRSKGQRPPHMLVMTATPIPRTVAMTVFGDLDVSTLAELPAGRAPIATHVVPVSERPNYLDRAWERIREETAAGRQTYVVCPRIGGTDDEEPPAGEAENEAEERRPPAAVADVAPQLAAGPLAGLRLEVLHGRLPADTKEAVMTAFAAGRLDVLVATTVVEVGVDVPNATVMAILDADRFGISQLHQLRGRVGRGGLPGLCLLITDAPPGSPARERLDAVAATCDGFELSRLDLWARREGDVLGAAQSGRRSSLKLLEVLRHGDLIAAARAAASAVLEDDPELTSHPGLALALADLLDTERADYLEKV